MSNTHDVVIIGDGPGGLSAALFLAKNDMDVAVIGTDDTPMHKAMLYNYLGVPEMAGSDFQERARTQVAGFGTEIHDAKVASARRDDGTFVVETEGGDVYRSEYLLIATGSKKLASDVGITPGSDGEFAVDLNGRTDVEGAYMVGWLVRGKKIQAIISAGDGAAVALDILSKEAGKDVHDFDVVD